MTLITDLDNNIIDWKPKGEVVNIDRKPKSSLHKKARKLLLLIYRTVIILEEVSIPVSDKHKLYLDFYIPLYKIAIEVHGKQHYEFVKRFHKDKIGFIKHKQRDCAKAKWCENNNIKLIILPYNEVKQWLQILV